MKLTAFLLFAFVATVVAAHRQRVSNSLEKDYLRLAKPFTSGNVYRFKYDSQISSGLGSMDASVTGEQKSTHRFSAMVHVNFETDRSATLHLEEIRIASLNGELPELRRVQSLQLFDEETVESQKLEQLQMSCTFEYSEGVIERVYFNGKDTVWSKNIKRAILNLVQLNLKERDNQENMQIESSDVSLSKMFTVNETTVEGKCETVYTVTKVSNNDADSEVYNVTKAIDFKKCSKIPTMHYGRRQEIPTIMAQKLQLEGQQQQQIERSTVLRYQIVGTLDKYAVANSELLSQYTIDSEETQAAMQTVVAARLTVQSVERSSSERRQDRNSNTKEETLLYSTEWDLIEKRFYQYGDEEYTGESTPFRHVQNKVKLIVSMIRKLAESTTDKSYGIESETTVKLQKAVELLRMCDMKEIQRIHSEVESNESERDILMDVCAMAGTRNTIHFMIEKIMSGHITSTKATILLRQLSSLPAISDKQIDIVLRLCKHDTVEKSASLRQACWLTVGSMIGDLCKKSSSSIQEHNEMCPRHKKEQLQKVLWTQFTASEDLYEKLIALKAIGNAGNELAVLNLEKIISDRNESPLIRIHAIDALRRLRNEMPRKIQRLLLPIFKNTLEVPEVRMTAFSMLMATFPDKVILDQITYTLHSERSNHVKSFVVRCYKALSTSPLPEEREMAPHLRTALTLANVDLDMACLYHRIPLYFGDRQEGLFLNLASIFSTSDGIPKHLSASIDSLFNGLFEKDTVSLSLTQQNLEDLYHRFMQNWNQMGERGIRAQRSTRNGEQEIDTIFDDFKIKTREAFAQTSFGLINLRINDIDQVVLPLGEEYMPKILKAIYSGEQLTAKSLHSSLLSGTPIRFSTGLSFQERSIKIATSAGMPLLVIHSLPVIAAFNGKVQIHVSSENVKITVKAQQLLSGLQTRKMEIWCPIINTGVESVRSVELNLPIDMEATVMNKNDEEKVKLTLRVPEQKTRIASFHSLPLTFIRKYDSKVGLHGKTLVKTIHTTLMDSRLKELHPTETSFTVRGHIYYPREMSLSSLNAMAWSHENHVEVDFDRRSECADALELVVTSKLFQNAETSSAKPRFETFYQDNKKFQPVYDDDVEDSNDDETELHNDRRSRLTNYLKDEYKPRSAYRHFIKAVVRTVGGQVNHKASANLEATCDSHMAFCRINTDIHRTPMLHGEKSEWTLKSESQFLMPEYVREVSELNDKKTSRNNRFAATLNAEWGCKELQKINVQLQGERAVPQQWMQRSSGEEWRRVLATAFINKYDLVADYKLSPSMKSRLQHYFELLKYWNYWNTDSSDSMDAQENEVKATLIIDPRTRQHFNVSIKTPTQRTRLTNVQIPMTIKPFPLIRPQEQSRYEINSVEDIVTEYSDSRRAECRVDGRRIKTFDSVTYKAPIGRCYSIIAKDCARKSFVVLMKTIDEETEAKNIKIVTAKKTIEVEFIREKLVVKVNGEKINEDRLREYNIDYSEDMVRVMLPEGVSVRFDGKQATVKLSNYYKNAQCGLCGEFNGEQNDEFRMNDNSLTEDVKDFHRSYSMLDDEGCKNIYNKDTLFGSASSKSAGQYSDDDDFENDDINDEVEEYEMFDRRSQQQSRNAQKNDDEEQDEEPITKTRVMEYNHKICFSLKPVKECPRGTTMEESDEIKVQFTCKNRSSTEARRLLRETKTADISSKLEFNKPSFVETVRSARVCA